MNQFSNIDKIRAFVAPNMTYLVTFLDNDGKPAVCTGGYICGIYSYMEMIGAPTKFTHSVQLSRNFSPSYSINNDAESPQPVI